MSALLDFWPYLVGAGAVLFALITGRSWGKSSAEAKQAGKDRKAAAERIEMGKERNDIAGRVGGMSDEELDAEVMKRTKR